MRLLSDKILWIMDRHFGVEFTARDLAGLVHHLFQVDVSSGSVAMACARLAAHGKVVRRAGRRVMTYRLPS